MWGIKHFAKLNQSQKPEPQGAACFWCLGAGAGASGTKNQEPEPLGKKIRSRSHKIIMQLPSPGHKRHFGANYFPRAWSFAPHLPCLQQYRSLLSALGAFLCFALLQWFGGINTNLVFLPPNRFQLEFEIFVNKFKET